MNPRQRLDKELVKQGIVATRSQAESYIRLGSVTVNGREVKKPGLPIREGDKIKLNVRDQYVSRAGMKLESIAKGFSLDFRGKTVLDVGSSTGGFTDYALRNGAQKVIAVDVGTNQLHPSLRNNPKVELHEQTDIRQIKQLSASPDYVVIDVSFISLREILPSVTTLTCAGTKIIAMVKPQFESGSGGHKHKGVIKNEKMRREILKDFEIWTKVRYKILEKADSQVSGEKGNKERFYLLTSLKK